MTQDMGQAGAHGEYKGRGVFVPDGQKASWIMEGAWVLEREFDVAPYTSREIVRAVLEAVITLIRQIEKTQAVSSSCVSE